MMDHLKHLPRVTLSAECDQRIRAAIASTAPSPVAHDMSEHTFRLPRLVFALAVFVAIVGVSGYAYASPNVTRGDGLYPVKRTMERVRGSAIRTPVTRVQYHSDLALRRAAELGVLLRERSAPTGIALIPSAYAQEGDPAEPTPDMTGEPDGGTKGGGTSDVALSEDPIVATTIEVAIEVEAAATAAEDITEPAVAEIAIAALVASQTEVTSVLEDAANSAGVEDANVTEAIAIALETVDTVATTTASAATEVTAASEAGETTVTLELTAHTELAANDADATADANGDADDDAEEIAELQTKLTDARTTLASLQTELTDAGVPAERVTQLTTRIGAKLDAAAAALEHGNAHQARGLLKAAKALRNNAKHFFRQSAQRAERAEDATAALVGAQAAITASTNAIGEDAPAAAQRVLAAAQEKLTAAQAAADAGEFKKARALAKVAAHLAVRADVRAEHAAARDERAEDRAERAGDRAERATERVERKAERAAERVEERAERTEERAERAAERRDAAIELRGEADARAEAAPEARERAREALDAVTDRVEDLGEQGRDTARDALDRATERSSTRERP